MLSGFWHAHLLRAAISGAALGFPPRQTLLSMQDPAQFKVWSRRLHRCLHDLVGSIVLYNAAPEEV